VRMRPLFSSVLAVAALAVVSASFLLAQERTRATVPDQYKWNLAELYPSDEAWQAERGRIDKDLSNAAAFKGTLGQSADQLLRALDLNAAQDKALNRLATYAGLKADEDTRISANQGLRDQVIQLGSKAGAEWAYLEPEILTLDSAKVDAWIVSTPGLKPYALYLHDILRRKTHTLSAAEEALLARTGPMAAGVRSASNVLLNADLPWPTVTLADGKQVRLDVSGFSAARASANREDRRKVMDAFFAALGSYRRTLGAAMGGNVQGAIFHAQARHYGSTLEAALDGPNIPTGVYQALVDGVNQHLPSFHRYLALRKKILHLDELHYYDLYAPLVNDVPLSYSVEQAQANIKAAMAPLGADYVAGLDKAFHDRWIDYYPMTGKQSGAYMSPGAYDVHPFLLLNYNGQYADMSAMAHELGHAMHSYFAGKNQPYPTYGYPIFVAEVASTFNENLLIDHMLKQISDPKVKLALLGTYLENVKGTVFRQAQFAEFELRMHQMAESGQPITGDALSKLYLDITRKYYGHDAHVCIVDDSVAHEWAYISHFYTPFYVYQYATSFTASTALSEKVIAGTPEAVAHYRAFLASGGSKYPIDLLKGAGVDMATSEPLDLTIRKMDRVMDEIEKLIQ
jgi:oligoendopeptidase F